MMNRTEKLKSIFKDGNEIAKTCDVKQLGFSNDEIARLCNEGILTRIKHGYYSLGDRLISDEQVISTLLPDVILQCHLKQHFFIMGTAIMLQEHGILRFHEHFQERN